MWGHLERPPFNVGLYYIVPPRGLGLRIELVFEKNCYIRGVLLCYEWIREPSETMLPTSVNYTSYNINPYSRLCHFRLFRYTI